MTNFAIAGLQLEAVNGDNLSDMLREIDDVMSRFPWLQMLLLAELNVCGSDPARAEPLPSEAETRFCEAAAKHGVWLIPGSVLELSDGKTYNTTSVINPDGRVIARYRKLFPFTPYEQATTPGDRFVVFDVPDVGRFGVSICYDMWFPETIRAMVCMGAEVILHPSMTGTIDRDVEVAMVRAHAAQNQVYFLDVNVAGPLGVGQSCFAGPGGEVLYQAKNTREIIPVKINLDYLRDVRANGWQNLGQPLKSFRDSDIKFPQHQDGYDSAALQALGKLRKPERNS